MSNLVDMWTTDAAKIHEKSRAAVFSSSGEPTPVAEQPAARAAAGSGRTMEATTPPPAPVTHYPGLSQTLRIKPRSPPRASTPCSDAALSMMVDCFSP